MFDKILYPTDGSDGAEAALDDVRNLAKTNDATVHILYVINKRHAANGIAGEPNQGRDFGMAGDPQGGESSMAGDRLGAREMRLKAIDHGAEIVDHAASQLGDVDCRTALRGGDIHQVILDYAEKNRINLIVMGTNSRTGLDRYLAGSVTEKIVRLSDIPVMTVRESDEMPT